MKHNQPKRIFFMVSLLVIWGLALSGCANILPAAQATPTEVAEATPTEAAEATPTEAPEATPTEAAEATPTEAPAEEAMIPSVTVNDQEISDDMVTVAEVVSDGPGWIVIHADQEGAPGPVVGHSAVSEGVNTDVTVEIDTENATETLYAMLHTDVGEAGVYEFPGADGPVQVEGQIVTPAFTVTGLPMAEEEEPEAAEPTMVQVSLVQWDIEMPETLPPGPTVFEVTNNGTFEHNFEIEGQGIEQVFEQNLEPGETRTLEVDLPAGEYRVYCPVSNHAERGMELTLTVTSE